MSENVFVHVSDAGNKSLHLDNAQNLNLEYFNFGLITSKNNNIILVSIFYGFHWD